MFAQVLADLKALRDALAAHNVHDSRHEFENVLHDVNVIWDGFDGRTPMAADEAIKAECHSVVSECMILCDRPAMGSSPVGKLGDGKLLELLKTLLPLILPLFI